MPGWRTDRGEVFITLGPPDESIENTPGTGNRVVRWSYQDYRLDLYFLDETGFGRLRLTRGLAGGIRADPDPGPTGSKLASAMPPAPLPHRRLRADLSRLLRDDLAAPSHLQGREHLRRLGRRQLPPPAPGEVPPRLRRLDQRCRHLVPRGAVSRLQVHPGKAGRGAAGRLRPRARADPEPARGVPGTAGRPCPATRPTT